VRTTYVVMDERAIYNIDDALVLDTLEDDLTESEALVQWNWWWRKSEATTLVRFDVDEDNKYQNGTVVAYHGVRNEE